MKAAKSLAKDLFLSGVICMGVVWLLMYSASSGQKTSPQASNYAPPAVPTSPPIIPAPASQAPSPSTPPEINQLREYDKIIRPDAYGTPPASPAPAPTPAITPKALRGLYSEAAVGDDYLIANLQSGTPIQITETRQNGMVFVRAGDFSGWMKESDLNINQ